MKIASRLFLPLEFALAYTLVSWGLSGWIGGAALYRELGLEGKNLSWGVILCGIGSAQLAAAGVEWFIGRRWGNGLLELWVRGRCVLAFVAACAWLYVAFYMGTAGNREVSFALWLQAPAGVFFSVWAFVGNYKVLCLLDPNVSTARLQRAMLAEREQSLGGAK